MKGLLRNFVLGLSEGLFGMSAASLLIAATTIIVTVLSVFFTVDPTLLSRIPDELMRQERQDLDILAIQKTLDMHSTAPAPLQVTLIGASSLHEAILDTKKIEALLASKLDTEIKVTKITARGLEVYNLTRFIDYLPEGYEGIVLFSVSLENLPIPSDISELYSRFPLPSSTFNELLEHEGIKRRETGVYLLDYYRFFSVHSVRLIKSLLFGPIPPVNYYMSGVKTSERSPEEKRKIRNKVRIISESSHLYLTHNQEILAAIYKKLETHGIYGVFLHPPRNIDFLQPIYVSLGKKDYLNKIDNEYRNFAEKQKVTYWNFNNTSQFCLDDFRDHSHISNDEARSRYTNMLVDNLAELINEKFLIHQ